MNSHHPADTYFRQDARVRLRQQVYRQHVPGNTKVWHKLWNLLLILSMALLMANLYLSHIIANLDQAIQIAENVRHELTDRQIRLRAARQELYSPENILMLASQRLALHVPKKEQQVEACR